MFYILSPVFRVLSRKTFLTAAGKDFLPKIFGCVSFSNFEKWEWYFPTESVEGRSRVMVTLWLLCFPLPPTHSSLLLAWESPGPHLAASLLLQGPLSFWYILPQAWVPKKTENMSITSLYLLLVHIQHETILWLFFLTARQLSSVPGVHTKKCQTFLPVLGPDQHSRRDLICSGNWARVFFLEGSYWNHPSPCSTPLARPQLWHLEEKVVRGDGDASQCIMVCQTWLCHQRYARRVYKNDRILSFVSVSFGCVTNASKLSGLKHQPFI